MAGSSPGRGGSGRPLPGQRAGERQAVRGGQPAVLLRDRHRHVEEKPLKNYNQAFNVGAIQMHSITCGGAARLRRRQILPAEQAQAKFRASAPHPANWPSATRSRRPNPRRCRPAASSRRAPRSAATRRDGSDHPEAAHRAGLDSWSAAEELATTLRPSSPAGGVDQGRQRPDGASVQGVRTIKDPRAIDPLLKTWQRAAGRSGADIFLTCWQRLATAGGAAAYRPAVQGALRLPLPHRPCPGHPGGPEAEAALKELAPTTPSRPCASTQRRCWSGSEEVISATTCSENSRGDGNVLLEQGDLIGEALRAAACRARGLRQWQPNRGSPR